MISDRIGRAAVSIAWAYLRRRYRREIRIGFGVAALALAVAAFFATRNVPEG